MSDFNHSRKTLEGFITNDYDVRPSTAKQIVTVVEQIIKLENHEYEEGIKDGRAEVREVDHETMIEVSETMVKFLKFLADRRYTNRRGVIAEAIFDYYRDEWIEYKKMIEAEVDNE